MNTIPERLEEWTIETIDSLIGLRDIESEFLLMISMVVML